VRLVFAHLLLYVLVKLGQVIAHVLESDLLKPKKPEYVIFNSASGSKSPEITIGSIFILKSDCQSDIWFFGIALTRPARTTARSRVLLAGAMRDMRRNSQRPASLPRLRDIHTSMKCERPNHRAQNVGAVASSHCASNCLLLRWANDVSSYH
jgi:hypothetical protein